MENKDTLPENTLPETKDNPPKQKKPETPAGVAQNWPTPKNTYTTKGRPMDRKPGSRGSARGR